MLTKLLNLLSPQSVTKPLKTAQEYLSGKKTYLAAAILLLQALVSLLEQFAGLAGAGDVFNWLKDLPQNAVVYQAAQALAIFGLRAGLAKASVE